MTEQSIDLQGDLCGRDGFHADVAGAGFHERGVVARGARRRMSENAHRGARRERADLFENRRSPEDEEGRSDGGRQVSGTGVHRDEEVESLDDRGELAYRRPAGEVRDPRGRGELRRDGVDVGAVFPRSREDEGTTAIRERSAELDESLQRPSFEPLALSPFLRPGAVADVQSDRGLARARDLSGAQLPGLDRSPRGTPPCRDSTRPRARRLGGCSGSRATRDRTGSHESSESRKLPPPRGAADTGALSPGER